MSQSQSQSQSQSLLLTIPEVLDELHGVSRSALYLEMKSGRLRSIKRGKRRLVSRKALLEFVEVLENSSGAESANGD